MALKGDSAVQNKDCIFFKHYCKGNYIVRQTSPMWMYLVFWVLNYHIRETQKNIRFKVIFYVTFNHWEMNDELEKLIEKLSVL